MKTDTNLYTKYLSKYLAKYLAKYLGVALLLLLLMMTTSCGAKTIRGAAPMVRMTELSHQDNTIALQLSLRNLNGVPLDILKIDFSLSIDGNGAVVYQGPVDTTIAANGTEAWPVEVKESQSIREVLDKLQNGDVNSLPYVLKGSITSKEDGTLRFEYEGHIYPLPGRPGHFR
jgi:hypothetical protein